MWCGLVGVGVALPLLWLLLMGMGTDTVLDMVDMHVTTRACIADVLIFHLINYNQNFIQILTVFPPYCY